jgi:hypothetical protein
MHTRRFGAFLVGAWLLGTVLVWFFNTQTVMTVERFFSNPPTQAIRHVEGTDADVLRPILRHQALHTNRLVTETWEAIQLGICAALLVVSIFTAHRSKVTVACGAVMMIIMACMAFYLTPRVHGIAQALDFLPHDAAPGQRAVLAGLEVWRRTLEVLKTSLGLLISVRLLFDFYEFRQWLLTASASNPDRRKRNRSRAAAAVPSAHVGNNSGLPSHNSGKRGNDS